MFIEKFLQPENNYNVSVVVQILDKKKQYFQDSTEYIIEEYQDLVKVHVKKENMSE